MSFQVKTINREDDLELVVSQINAAQWDADDVQTYAVTALRSYLNRQDTLFLVCYLAADSKSELVGMASARFEQKPYGNIKWLYIDEVDTCRNRRQQGVGTALMQRLLQIALESECEEVWLGTEKSNHGARRFYESLKPDAIDDVIGYTFEL